MAERSPIPEGTKVIALDGEALGTVREVQDYYILVDQPDAHDDLEVPSNAVGELEGGVLRLTVNRSALSAVDDEEAARHQLEDEGG